jgi:hypothetical protein
MIPNPTQPVEAAAALKAAGPKSFRRLRWNELVSRGDFVADGNQGFEPWEGPSGFRADAFVKQIYRRLKRRPAGAKKPV